MIARDGLERATIRTIAEETGWSTGVLAHYFTDKEDILASALQLSHERIAARWDEKLEGLQGLAALRELVLDNLPARRRARAGDALPLQLLDAAC